MPVADCPPDAMFGDEAVRSALEELVEGSNFGAPQAERREQWAWIVEGPGRLEVVRIQNEADNPCQVAASLDPPPGVVGWAHTHPFEGGERVEPGICPQAPGGGTYREGPSRRDIETGDRVNDEAGATIPGFIIDPAGVLRFTVEEDPVFGPRVGSQEKFAGCIAGGTA